MRKMDLITALFPAKNTLSDGAAGAKLGALKAALVAGDLSRISTRQKLSAERIVQAAQKIESGVDVKRLSELMTLAKFGPASIGLAVARACDDEPSGPIAEGFFVARFLVEVVFAAYHTPALLPGDMLKEYQLERSEICWPSVQPVCQGLLSRASQTISRTDDLGIWVASPDLRKMLAKHRMQTIYQIKRLRNRDPASPRARITRFDNMMISFKVFLRRWYAS